uniref:RRAD and GEM like GTPase 1 n=1 Tax=Bos mutus grunniens TaxID=30521 RepID=A0A8C0AD85_BOSMU
MTLNTQQEAKTPLRRRASTPLPLSARGHQPGLLGTAPSTQTQHPRLGQSVSLNAPTRQPSPAPNGWSSESSDSESSWEALYRVVLLGDPGVGKTSLASLFAGRQERDLHEQLGEDVYERTLTVDGEDTTLLVMDTWEAEKLDESWSQESCLQVGSAYVIVYSIADRGSFESASELRIQLRRTPGGPRAHHPGGQQGRSGTLPRSLRGRGPRLRCGIRLQVHRDVSHAAAQRSGALRRRGAPTALAPPGLRSRGAARAQTKGEPRAACSTLPGSLDSP